MQSDLQAWRKGGFYLEMVLHCRMLSCANGPVLCHRMQTFPTLLGVCERHEFSRLLLLTRTQFLTC